MRRFGGVGVVSTLGLHSIFNLSSQKRRSDCSHTLLLISHPFQPWNSLPIFTAAFWLTNILGLLGLWGRDNWKQYETTEATIVFISDVGGVKNADFFLLLKVGFH